MLKTSALGHGGIMVNYQCPAACRHCLYACSPTRSPGYVSGEKIREICALLRRAGCDSVHIGGGEPFLDFQGLLRTVRELRRGGVNLEYIETNAFWAGEDADRVIEKLRALMAEGADTLCISLDPFHAEYLPYGRPLRLVRLCEEAGIGYFLWKQEFLHGLRALSPERPQSRDELAAGMGADYIGKTAQDYGIHYGGRAINIEEEFGTAQRRDAAALTDDQPCRNLLAGGHFHIDKDGCFIPPGCTGLRLPLGELVEGIPEGAYPVFEALYRRGLAGLLALARERGFNEDDRGYVSKCALCFHLRRGLAEQGFAELDADYYRESLSYYD